MKFIEVKESIINVLGSAAAGRFVVFGYQKQGQRAEDLLGNKRNVQVYFGSGEMPESKSGLTGPVQHDPTFKIDCMVSTKAQVNLSALTDPSSTPAEKALALANTRTASYLADNSLDELFSIIWNILNDGRNVDLGMDEPVASRWIPRISKDTPLPVGEYCVLTGTMELTCSIVEEPVGEEPVLGTDGVHTDYIAKDEPDSQMGVSNESTFIIDDDTGDYLIDDESGDYIVED